MTKIRKGCDKKASDQVSEIDNRKVLEQIK